MDQLGEDDLPDVGSLCEQLAREVREDLTRPPEKPGRQGWVRQVTHSDVAGRGGNWMAFRLISQLLYNRFQHGGDFLLER